MKLYEIEALVEVLTSATNIHGMDPPSAKLKKHVHAECVKYLKCVASLLGLAASEYTIRSNPAGPGISGEVTLHTDALYVQICPDQMDLGVLYRRVASRADFVGERNQWYAFVRLLNVARFVETLREVSAPRPASVPVQRFWMGWYGGSDGDCRPLTVSVPFAWWCTGEEYDFDGLGLRRARSTLCAVVDAEDVQAAWACVGTFWPEAVERFAEARDSGWFPSSDRFPSTTVLALSEARPRTPPASPAERGEAG